MASSSLTALHTGAVYIIYYYTYAVLYTLCEVTVSYVFSAKIQQKPIKCQCCSHIEASRLICCVNRLTGFYMRATLVLNRLKSPYKGYRPDQLS